MKKYLTLPLLAALAATPAFAQMSNDSPNPNLNTPGSGAEQRDDNVWGGAEESTGPGVIVDDADDDNLVIGEADDDVLIGDDDDDLLTGRSSTHDFPPNRALPGSGAEQRDENVWHGGQQPLD